MLPAPRTWAFELASQVQHAGPSTEHSYLPGIYRFGSRVGSHQSFVWSQSFCQTTTSFLQPPWTVAQQRHGPTSSLTPAGMAVRLGVPCLSPPNIYTRHPNPSATSRWLSVASPKSTVSTTFSNVGRRVPSSIFSSRMATHPAVTAPIRCAHLHI